SIAAASAWSNRLRSLFAAVASAGSQGRSPSTRRRCCGACRPNIRRSAAACTAATASGPWSSGRKQTVSVASRPGAAAQTVQRAPFIGSPSRSVPAGRAVPATAVLLDRRQVLGQPARVLLQLGLPPTDPACVVTVPGAGQSLDAVEHVRQSP